MAESEVFTLDPDPICAPGINGGTGWASNEFDSGRRLGWEYARRLRWIQTSDSAGYWVVYRQGRWAKETLKESLAAAMSVATSQIIENNGEGARTSTYLKNILNQAKRWLAIEAKLFDADPLLLGCSDGVLSLRREDCGKLLDHAPEYLMTMSTGVSLRGFCNEAGVVVLPEDFGWGLYKWEQHLEYMTQNLQREDDLSAKEAARGVGIETEKALEFRLFFMRWSGTSLIGSQDLKPQHFLNLSGSGGRIGKGVAAEARVAALGDYGLIGPKRLVTRKESDHSTEIASCQGKRLLVLEEIGLANGDAVKDLTGGGTITGRKMRMDDITFSKSWTTEMNSNKPLNLQGESTKAMKKRKIVANLGSDEVPEGAMRDGVINELRAERDIILCWMIEGLRRWYSDGGRTAGLAIPGWMKEVAARQMEDDDVIGALIAERYVDCGDECGVNQHQHHRVLGSVFIKAVNERRKESGFLPLSPASVYAYMRDRGNFVGNKGDGNRTYIYGLRLGEQTFGEVIEGARASGSGLN